jgi:hypothetical protein
VEGEFAVAEVPAVRGQERLILFKWPQYLDLSQTGKVQSFSKPGQCLSARQIEGVGMKERELYYRRFPISTAVPIVFLCCETYNQPLSRKIK